MLSLLLVLAAVAGPGLLPMSAVDPDIFGGKRYALLVGPESFDDDGFADLRFADDDAVDLSEALATNGHFDRMWTLTAPADASLDGVRGAMDELAGLATSRQDTVFVYLSSHGTIGRGGDGQLRQFVVLSDTRLADIAGTALSHDTLLDWLEALPSRRKVLVLATCHSGQGKSALPRDVAEELASHKSATPLTPLRSVSEAVVLIGVCAWNETAREAEGLGHDIYTWYLLEALDRADVDGDSAVTVTEAHDHARRRTYAYTGGAQRPYARAEILGSDPIVLSGEPRHGSAATVGSYRPRLEGHRLRVDGQVKGSLPGLVPIEPGAHKVELLAPDEDRVIASQRVRLNAGTRTEVATLIRRDRFRLGGGGGWLGVAIEGTGGPQLSGEVHLPRLLGRGWEIIAQGSTLARWPHPTLDGSIVAEHSIVPGPLQLRAGGGLQGFLLNSNTEPRLLAPSLTPVPSLSVAWLPKDPIFVRLSATTGVAWYAEDGAFHFGGFGRVLLSAGGAL